MPVAIICLSSCFLVSGQYYAFGGVQDNVNTVTGERPKRLNIENLQSDPISWYAKLNFQPLLYCCLFERL